MFEIVVDKKLVPKEVLETGGKKTENLSPNNIMISHIALRGSTGLRLSEFAQISEFFQF